MRATFIAALLSLAAVPANATTITLDFSALPSAQGWTYVSGGAGTGIADSALFSIGGGVLRQDTMGIATDIGGGNYYLLGVPTLAGNPWTLTVRARLLAFESNPAFVPPYPFSFAFGPLNTYAAIGGPQAAAFANVINYAAFPAGYIASSLNTFVLTGGTGRFDVTVNGQPLFTNLPDLASGTILLGDATGFANAIGEIAFFELVIDDGIVPVPAPGALALFGLGLAGLGLRRR